MLSVMQNPMIWAQMMGTLNRGAELQRAFSIAMHWDGTRMNYPGTFPMQINAVRNWGSMQINAVWNLGSMQINAVWNWGSMQINAVRNWGSMQINAVWNCD